MGCNTSINVSTITKQLKRILLVKLEPIHGYKSIRLLREAQAIYFDLNSLRIKDMTIVRLPLSFMSFILLGAVDYHQSYPDTWRVNPSKLMASPFALLHRHRSHASCLLSTISFIQSIYYFSVTYQLYCYEEINCP